MNLERLEATNMTDWLGDRRLRTPLVKLWQPGGRRTVAIRPGCRENEVSSPLITAQFQGAGTRQFRGAAGATGGK